MSGRESIEQTNLVIRVRAGAKSKAYWDAQWRCRLDENAPWRFRKQRLGVTAPQAVMSAWRPLFTAGGNAVDGAHTIAIVAKRKLAPAPSECWIVA